MNGFYTIHLPCFSFTLVIRTWNLIPSDQAVAKITQIDSGTTKAVWAINERDAVYILKDFNKWILVQTNQKYITAGESGVWAVDVQNQVQLRLGISDKLPEGKQWYRVNGKMKKIDSGPLGVLCGITVETEIKCRTGVTLTDPKGNGWSPVPFERRPKRISCGEYGCWVLTKSNKVRFSKSSTNARILKTHLHSHLMSCVSFRASRDCHCRF